jgi:type II secretory pathway pseudopilin PulG
MTLVEVLVVFGVIAVLAGIVLTGLRGVLDRRDAVVCLTHIRSLGSVVAMYTGDQRDYFPSWIERGVDYESSPERWPEFAMQSYTTMYRPEWLEYTGFQSTTAVMYCPANSRYEVWNERAALPDYWLTAAAYMTPEHLNPDVPDPLWLNRLGGRVQRMSMTRFPSSKAGMYEMFVWHAWRGVYEPGVEMSGLEYHNSNTAASVWFIDGHARQMHVRDATPTVRRHPVWPSGTYNTTAWGMQGMDIR